MTTDEWNLIVGGKSSGSIVVRLKRGLKFKLDSASKFKSML